MQQAQTLIDQAWENRAELKPAAAPRALRDAIEFALAGLDAGRLRVAEKRDDLVLSARDLGPRFGADHPRRGAALEALGVDPQPDAALLQSGDQLDHRHH